MNSGLPLTVPVRSLRSLYGAHAITSWYHQGTPLYACAGEDPRVFGTPRADLGTASDTIYASWDTLFVSDDKHAMFLSEQACDDGCYFTDECAPQLVMNDGRLVSPGEGQFFHLFNIGEINDPLIENFTEINPVGGFTFDSRRVWGDPSIDERYYWVSDGPSCDVYFTTTALPYPNPARRCRDQSLGVDTWYKSLFRVRVSMTTGQILREKYLGEFCWGGDDIRLHLWDGKDLFGDCLTGGPKLVELSAIRTTATCSPGHSLTPTRNGFRNTPWNPDTCGREAAWEKPGIGRHGTRWPRSTISC